MIFVRCFYAQTVFAVKNDSLFVTFKTYNKEDTNRVNILNNIGWKIINNQPDSALKLFLEANNISKALRWKIGEAKSEGNIGVAYYYLGNYPMALHYYLLALNKWEQQKNLKNMATLYGNIGIIHGLEKDYNQAEKYYLKAIAIAERLNDKQSLARNYGNLGMVLSYQNKNQEALAYHYKAMKIDEQLLDSLGLSADLGNIGSVYLSTKNYSMANSFFKRALALSEQLNDKAQMAVWYANIGSVYVKQKNYYEAERNFLKALTLDESVGTIEGLIEDHKSLYELYSLINKPDKAFTHFKKYIELRDSVYNEENTKKLVKAEMNFEFEKKEAINKAKQEQQRLIIYGITFFLLLLIVFSFFIYNRFKVTNKQKLIIEQQKKEVEVQREIALEQKKISEDRKQEILDSIHYASRIQRAMITSNEYISQQLKRDYFILYMPKDIVAGDFYWALAHGNLFYFLTGDCTGHGVPGAFMSLLNIGFLNELVLERGLIMPNEILNEQRSQIIKALNPTGTENSNDGMDCVLTAFDFSNNTLYFAQANNSLIIIRNKEIIEFKGQKIPVGKSELENEPFKLQTFQLMPHDCIYTFTDGFSDQFGINQKKFMSKNLKNLLLNISHLPMAEQKVFLTEAFNKHKGNEEQTDDVLIVGIRI